MENSYVLFIIGDCSFCDKARKALKGQKFTTIDVSNDLMVRGQVKEAFGWRTFPIILKKDGADLKLVGGFTDLEVKLGPDG